LGRIDGQVKIRGFRIELGEVQARLLKRPDLKEALVIDRTDSNNEKYLCAYICPVEVKGNEVSAEVLREYLSQYLPEHMVPSRYVVLETIPLTPSGKPDRKALPEPGRDSAAQFRAPRTTTEIILEKLWSELLGRKKSGKDVNEGVAGIDDNFFTSGGHSLKAVTLISRMHREFNVKVPLNIVFRFPTISGIAAYIDETSETRHWVEQETIVSTDSAPVELQPVEMKEYYPLSSA
jgi:acyl carrier protein